MTTITTDPKHLGARIGITAVLHTWSLAMTHHPHIHMSCRAAASPTTARSGKATERTTHGLWNAIGRILAVDLPQECANAGYDAD
jgi:hypothetical protein